MNTLGDPSPLPMTEPARRLPLMALILAILLLASALRFHRLGEQSLWYDEGVSYALSLRTLPELIPHLQRDVHPPAFVTLLGWWQRLTGVSEFALRALSALFSITSVAWTYALGRRLHHPLAGLAAAALVALNSFSIYYAQEARMYAMLAAVAGGSMWLFVGFHLSRRRWLAVIALGLVNALGLYTHVAYALVILAQALLFALWLGPALIREWRENAAMNRNLRLLMQFVLANLLTLTLFLPWLPVSLRQVFAQPNLSQVMPLDQTLRQIFGHLAYGTAFEHNFTDMTFFVCIFLFFGLIPTVIRRRTLWNVAAPVVWVMVSVAVYLYLGLTTRYLRFLLPAQMALALWLGRGVWMAWRLQRRDWALRWRHPAKLIIVLGAAFSLLPFFGNLSPLYNHPDFQRDDVRGLAARIESDLREGDALLVSAAGFGEVLGYYYRGEAPVFGLPTSRDGSATRAHVLELISAHDRLHVIFYGAEEQDPERVVETTLNLKAFEISDNWIDDVRYVQYKSEAPLASSVQAGVTFGDNISLDAYAVGAREVSAGDALPAQLVWTTDAALDRRYKVFLQLLDLDGRLAAQRDSEPVGGSAKTTGWPVGESVVDQHALLIPADLPAGDYTLIVGLYDINDPAARLAVEGKSYLDLGTVAVR